MYTPKPGFYVSRTYTLSVEDTIHDTTELEARPPRRLWAQSNMLMICAWSEETSKLKVIEFAVERERW